MHSYYKLLVNWFWLFFCCWFFWFVLSRSMYAVNLELESTDHYLLVMVCSAAQLGAMLTGYFSGWKDFTVFRLLYLLLICGFVAGYFLDLPFFYSGNEFTSYVFCILVAGYIFLFHVEHTGKQSFLFLVVALSLIQLLRAYYQMLSYKGIWPVSLAITGYFDNSALLSVYLVVTFPMMVRVVVGFFYKRYRLPGLLLSYMVLLAGVLGVLLVTLSRTSLLTLLVINLVMAGWYCSRQLHAFWDQHKRLMVLIVLVAIVTGIAALRWLFFFKQRSAEGRMLIWEICLKKIGEAPFLGWGMGSFTFNYPNWQAEYFAGHPKAPQSYFIAAGETVNSFNEYLQVLVEFGIPGLLLMVVVVVYVFRYPAKNGDGMTAGFYKLSFLSGLCAGFTFYTFHSNVLLLLMLVAALSVVGDGGGKVVRLTYNPAIQVLFWCMTAVLAAMAWKAAGREIAVSKFKHMEESHDLGPGQLQQIDKQLSFKLNHDGKILTRAGLLMMEYAEGEKAVGYFEQGRSYYSGYDIHLYLAQAYILLGSEQQALAQYEFLSHYIPSKFSPKYEQYKILRRIGKEQQARKLARMILEMPVKVPSPVIAQIKSELKEFLAH